MDTSYYFSDRWSLKGKIIYDQKGWNNGFLTDENGSSYPANYHLTYLTVPIMANWHFGGRRNWYLNFGPYIGFLTRAKAIAQIKETTVTNTATVDMKPFFNNVDEGLALGIGVKIPVSNRVKFFVELEGASGVANIIKSNDGSSIKNSRGSLNIGFNFL